jgi:hypothetical protein
MSFKITNNKKLDVLIFLMFLYIAGLSVMVFISVLMDGSANIDDVKELLLPALGIPLSYLIIPLKKKN